tara:strand:+ start:34 stop:444 length:411 start_codon:yes stop_codon:yes gene_type:complete
MGNVDTDKLKQLLYAMIETLDGEETSAPEQSSPTQPAEVPQKKKTAPKSNNPNVRKRQPYGLEENLFLDMPEKDMHKNDVLIDQKLKSSQPIVRNRPAALVDVRCRVCGKQEQVSAQLIVDGVNRYKCNNCARGAG